MRYVTDMLGKAICIYRCVRILSASVYIGWHLGVASLEFGKMGYSRSEKAGGQGDLLQMFLFTNRGESAILILS